MFHCDAGEPQLLGRNYFGRQLQCRRGFTLCKVQCTAFMPMYALNVAFSVFLCQAEYAAACPALLLFTTLRHCSSSVSWKRLSGKNPSEFKQSSVLRHLRNEKLFCSADMVHMDGNSDDMNNDDEDVDVADVVREAA